jgi:alanine dehydrogenase
MMTAAGTLTASKVFVVGAGVAGLSAIATAKRLGAVVRAYDVRPACREQVESLGGKFVELPLETTKAEGAGGYAQAQDEAFYQRQRELLANVVAESDVVITTAAIPGKQSPLLITAAAVARMQPGTVIVDLAAERGGNCAHAGRSARGPARRHDSRPTNLAGSALCQPDVRQRHFVSAEPGEKGRSRLDQATRSSAKHWSLTAAKSSIRACCSY